MPNYLYNGIELPALPMWDKATYPHAVIVEIKNGNDAGYWFVASAATFTAIDTGIMVGARFGEVQYMYDATSGEWLADTMSNLMVPFVRWANYDVYTTDGTLYLAASDPIPILAPVIDPLSMWMGWKAGNWVARQRGKKAEQEKTPIAYLYNGVRLPDINAVWTDKETYPYAIIAGYTIDASETDGAGEIVFADLLLYKNAAEQGSDTSEHLIVGQHAQYRATNDQEVADIYGISELNAWCLHGKDDSEDATMSADAATWTSHDILNADGSVYLATSDPVPVYE